MPRIRLLSLLLALAVVAACTAPTAPAPDSPAGLRDIQGPSFNNDTTSDSSLTGYQPGHG